MKKILAILLALAMVFSLAACGGSDPAPAPAPAPDNGGSDAGQESSVAVDTFIVRSIGDPMNFNPDFQADDNLFGIAQNMFRRLVGLDASKGNVVGEAAKDWAYSEDGLELTFHLRDDLLWSDGEALDADDVVYTFKAIKENPTTQFNSTMACIDDVVAPDSSTVVFQFNTPNMSFLYLLGWYGTFILPEHKYNNGEAWEDNEAFTNPVTCGPFKFDSFKSGESVTLVADPNYPDGSTVGRLIYSIIPDEATAVQALLNGEIDFMEAIPASYYDELQANPATEVFLNEYPSPVRIVYNFEDEHLGKQEVRKAVAMALNREDISTKVYNGIQPAEYTMYPSLIEWAADTEHPAPARDVEGAKALLESAGYTADADGFYIKGMEISVFEGGGYPEMAKLLKSYLEEIGIQTDVQVSEYGAWDNKIVTNREFDLTMFGGFMGPDPSGMAARIVTGGWSNVGSYSNPAVDELMVKGNAEADKATSVGYYKEAQKIISEELPYCPVVEYVGVDGYGSQYANMPGDGVGKWSWADFSHVTLK